MTQDQYEVVPGSRTVESETRLRGRVVVKRVNLNVVGGVEVSRHDIPDGKLYDIHAMAANEARLSISVNRDYYINKHKEIFEDEDE